MKLENHDHETLIKRFSENPCQKILIRRVSSGDPPKRSVDSFQETIRTAIDPYSDDLTISPTRLGLPPDIIEFRLQQHKQACAKLNREISRIHFRAVSEVNVFPEGHVHLGSPTEITQQKQSLPLLSWLWNSKYKVSPTCEKVAFCNFLVSFVYFLAIFFF